MDLKNKRGIIKVSDAIMWDFEIMKVVYSEFFPYHIEYEHWNKVFKIHGCCERFIEIKEGDVTPQYEFIITRSIENVLTLECSKA